MSAASQVMRDLSRFENQPHVRQTTAAEAPPVRVLPQTRVHGRASSSSIPVRGVLVFMFVMTLMLFIVYTYMRMAEMDRMSREILSEISALQKIEVQLQKQRASLIDLKEIERVATEELGMIKPSRNQIIYINLSGEDHAELIDG